MVLRVAAATHLDHPLTAETKGAPVTPSPGPADRQRRRWWVAGIVGVLAMTAIAVWFGIAATAGRVHWTNTGFQVHDDTRIEVRFDLVRDPAREVVCRLEALDAGHGPVGSTEVTVEATPSSPSRHTAELRTVTRATTGYVDSCHYAG